MGVFTEVGCELPFIAIVTELQFIPHRDISRSLAKNTYRMVKSYERDWCAFRPCGGPRQKMSNDKPVNV